MKLSDMQSLHYNILWRIIKARIHISFARRMINPLNIAPTSNRGNRKRSWLNLSRRSGLAIPRHIDKKPSFKISLVFYCCCCAVQPCKISLGHYNLHLSKITPFLVVRPMNISLEKEMISKQSFLLNNIK